MDGFDIGHATSPLGSGGMRSKVVAAEMATAAGIETVIASGLEPGMIPAAAAGHDVGTRFLAREGRYSSFKLWLKYAKPSRGRVLVDAGAARALREGGTSLLPVGVVDVAGTFVAGDAVEVLVWRAGGRQGHQQLLRGRAASGQRLAIGGRPRAPASGQPRGDPPGLLRARLATSPVGAAASRNLLTMASTTVSITDVCAAAQRASRELATLGASVKNAVLEAIATALTDATAEILEANARDLELGSESGLSPALLDRLALDPDRIAAMAAGVRAIAALPDPVGEVIDGSTLANGLRMRRVRVPLGVVAVVYEARPNVTIDAAALCLKSGNAVVLRGSSAAAHSNAVLAGVAIAAAEGAGLPPGALALLGAGDRSELAELASQTGVVDLIIPRGGEGLKAALKDVATVPVLYAASGNNHVYVDADANLEDALAIVLNAKLQRPGTCNAAEKLLVHRDVAATFLPTALTALAAGRRDPARRRAHAHGGPRGRHRRGHR